MKIDENPVNLSQRRQPRLVCDFPAIIKPAGAFRRKISGRVFDLSETGFAIETDTPMREFPIVEIYLKSIGDLNEFAVKGELIWVSEGDLGALKFRSGWRFKHPVGDSSRNLLRLFVGRILSPSVSDRRNNKDRRKILDLSFSDLRKKHRRLSDVLFNYNILTPGIEPKYRRQSGDRRNNEGISQNNQNTTQKRQKSDRRAITPIGGEQKFSFKNDMKRISGSLRDYFIFWLPGMVARKVVGEGSFAFITHPRDLKDIAKYYAFAKFVPRALLEFWLKWQWPVIGAQIMGVRKLNGTQTKGWLIFCPLTAKQMIENRSLAQRRVVEAVRFAQKVGAKIVGLGAFTSIVTHDGLDIRGNVGIGVTSGNALSAAVAVQNVVKAADLLGKPLGILSIAIVGAAGNVGSACARNLYKHVSKLILVDISKKALDLLCAELKEEIAQTEILASTSIDSIRSADIVIAVTNAPGAIVRSSHLKQGALVIDCAQPKNVSETVPAERPDVVVIESAIVKIPGVDCKFDLGIGSSEALGCMAETILLDAINWHKDYSVGKLTREQTSDVMALAKMLGLELAHFRHANGYVTERAFSESRTRD